MGGSSVYDDRHLTSLSHGNRTLVLVGLRGSGKSATGNSIIGRNAFKSMPSFSGVTSNCELQTTVLANGEVVNVMDTPGLFDSFVDSGFLVKDIVKFINMAKDGIHAVLVVLSFRIWFSEEEASALFSLQDLFGSRITDYMIVVFTGGDYIEDQTLEDYLGQNCSPNLQGFLKICKNRRVLFDNKTRDVHKRAHQVQQLLSLVDSVVAENDGKPFSAELIVEGKVAETLGDKQELIEEQLNRIAKMVESNLKEYIATLEKHLAEVEAARKRAEEEAKNAQSQSEKDTKNLRVLIERIQQLSLEN